MDRDQAEEGYEDTGGSLTDLDPGMDRIRKFWSTYIHDIDVATHPVGTKAFFDQLSEYRFRKLHYLTPIVLENKLQGKRVLDVGCGIGTELVQFARNGADVAGVDLCSRSIELAKENFRVNGLSADLQVMNGEDLQFESEHFDFVYARMPLQYTQRPEKMVAEIHRVLRRGGKATLIVFNRFSWLNLVSKLSGENLLHEDAPVFNLYTPAEFRSLLHRFGELDIVTDKLPTRTQAYRGIMVSIYNTMFIPLIDMIPKRIGRKLGAHIIATVTR